MGYYGLDGTFLWKALVRHDVKGKSVAVIGTESPWIEAMLIKLGARRVTTIEYKEIKLLYQRADGLEISTYTVTQAHAMFLKGQWEEVDMMVSFSSLEHDGLGRYGDPLNPEGDLRSMERLSCLLKKNGKFFLAVPVADDAIVWNLHRIYGRLRLPHLISGWEAVDGEGNFAAEHIFMRPYTPGSKPTMSHV